VRDTIVVDAKQMDFIAFRWFLHAVSHGIFAWTSRANVACGYSVITCPFWVL